MSQNEKKGTRRKANSSKKWSGARRPAGPATTALLWSCPLAIISIGRASGFMFFEVLCPGASEGLRKPILVTHIHTVFRTYSRKVLIFLYLRVQGGEQDA